MQTITSDLSLENRVQLPAGWKKRLLLEFEKPYMQKLKQFLLDQKKQGKVIYPPGPEIFTAMNLTDFDAVKVVIIGQDPYHGPGQAHGLSFSVKPGVPFPPSLLNIFKELEADIGIPRPKSGDLSQWAKQGVLLLNASLTVEQSQPMSHQNIGWEIFTDKIIEVLNAEREKLVFLLWGGFAQKKAKIVDKNRHFVIESAHPSPLSAHRGFLGSRPFSKINQLLIQSGNKPIDWTL